MDFRRKWALPGGGEMAMTVVLICESAVSVVCPVHGGSVAVLVLPK